MTAKEMFKKLGFYYNKTDYGFSKAINKQIEELNWNNE